MCAQNLVVLEREGIQRSAEFARGHDERGRQVLPLPARRESRALVEIGQFERVHEGEAADWGLVVSFDVRPIRHHGPQAVGKDLLEIGGQRRGGLPPRVHVFNCT